VHRRGALRKRAAAAAARLAQPSLHHLHSPLLPALPRLRPSTGSLLLQADTVYRSHLFCCMPISRSMRLFGFTGSLVVTLAEERR